MDINFTRNYLKAEEIMDIVNNMLQYDDYMIRTICKYLMIANYVTDYEVNKTEDGELIIGFEQYDELMENEFDIMVFDNLNNTQYINNAINFEESVNRTLIRLADNINSKLDGFGDSIKNINLEEIMDKLKK